MTSKEWNTQFIEKLNKGNNIYMALVTNPDFENGTGLSIATAEPNGREIPFATSEGMKRAMIEGMRSYVADYDKGKLEL